jgi:hypothetical protein
MRNADSLPQQESMKRQHKVRKYRRGNGSGRAYLGAKQKPWKPKAVAA